LLKKICVEHGSGDARSSEPVWSGPFSLTSGYSILQEIRLPKQKQTPYGSLSKKIS